MRQGVEGIVGYGHDEDLKRKTYLSVTCTPRNDRSKVCTGAVASQGNRVEGLCRPLRHSPYVLKRSGVRVLRREAVVDCNHRALGARCECAAERIVGVKGADHPAASVEPDERPVLATRWAVRAHTYACRGDLLGLLDLVESTEEADRIAVDVLPSPLHAQLVIRSRAGLGGCVEPRASLGVERHLRAVQRSAGLEDSCCAPSGARMVRSPRFAGADNAPCAGGRADGSESSVPMLPTTV